jgi:molybdate transport system regulatory protein
MVRLTIRIDFEAGQALGPGKVRLLEQIKEKGSIRGAASAMKMSYRRAWLLLKATEEIFGAPLVLRSTGGQNGGGAGLTALGREIVGRYRSAEAKASKAVEKDTFRLAHSRHSVSKKPGKVRKSA